MKHYKILVNVNGSKKWVALGNMGICWASEKRERYAIIISENCIKKSKLLNKQLYGRDYELIQVDDLDNAIGIYMDDTYFFEECP